MKKFLATALAVLSIACIFCGCGNVKFEDDNAMYDHLNGIWEYEYGNYLIFDNHNVYDCHDGIYSYFFNDAFLNAWREGGEDSFNALTYEKVIENVSLDNIAHKYDNVTNYASKGTIKIDEDSEYTGIIKIKKDIVEYKEEYSDDFITLTKISDEIDFNIEYLKEYYNERKGKYKLPVKDFIPTLKEYAEKLKNVFPDISSWKLAHQAEKSTIYTDTGSTTNYQDVITITDKIVMLSKYNNNLLITYTADVDSDMPSLFVQDKTGSHLSDVFASVDIFLEDYPKAMDMNELQNQFEENSKVSSGQRIYETTIDGVTYKIQRSNGSGTTMLWISL